MKMNIEDNVLFYKSDDTLFDDADNNSNNSGFVEATYKSSGRIVLRSTNDESRDISSRDLIKLMK